MELTLAEEAQNACAANFDPFAVRQIQVRGGLDDGHRLDFKAVSHRPHHPSYGIGGRVVRQLSKDSERIVTGNDADLRSVGAVAEFIGGGRTRFALQPLWQRTRPSPPG